MAKAKTTDQKIDALTVAMAKGFKGVDKKIDSLAVSVAKGFENVDKRFEVIEQRLDGIENVLIQGHDNRITRLEDLMLQVRAAVGIK